MKATVDKELCIGCGICESICPRVFFMDGDGKANTKTHPLAAEHKDCAQDAEEQCPVGAIKVAPGSDQEE